MRLQISNLFKLNVELLNFKFISEFPLKEQFGMFDQYVIHYAVFDKFDLIVTKTESNYFI